MVVRRGVASHFLLFLGFILSWGVWASEPLNKIVAIVNDNVITDQELNVQVARAEHELRQQQVSVPNKSVLKKQLLSRMVDAELQMQIAKDHGIEVSDEQVSAAISDIAKQHQMSIQALKQMLQAQGLTWPEYRRNIKKEMLIAKVQQTSVGAIRVSESEVDDFLKANQQQQKRQYHVKDILLPLAETPSSQTVAHVQNIAKKVLNELKNGKGIEQTALDHTSEKLAVQSMDLGWRPLAALPKQFATQLENMEAGAVVGPIRAPNGYHVLQLVAIKGDATSQPVTLTHVRHLLLKVTPGTSSQEVKQKIDSLALQIKRGRAFETLAEKFSDDSVSAAKGGDLGWLHTNETDPNFEQAYKTLAVGKISKPVKTNFGWHLIKVEGRKQVTDDNSYQKQQVRQALYQRKFAEAATQWVQQLRANAYVKVLI